MVPVSVISKLQTTRKEGIETKMKRLKGGEEASLLSEAREHHAEAQKRK